MHKLSLWLIYILLMIVGAGTMILTALLLNNYKAVPDTEYYYSDMLRSGFSIFTGILFFLIGGFVGFFTKANSWLIGVALIFCMPFTAIYEATIYRGSHNLIPFEMIFYFAYSLPAVLGSYVGKKIQSYRSK